MTVFIIDRFLDQNYIQYIIEQLHNHNIRVIDCSGSKITMDFQSEINHFTFLMKWS